MVVDDNRDAAESLGMLLSIAGHEVAVEGAPAAAIERAAPAPFDAWVVDIGLPGMDGYGLLRHLRALPGQGAVPAIALSGYGQPHDIEASRKAGLHTHLVKPMEVKQLLKVIGEL